MVRLSFRHVLGDISQINILAASRPSPSRSTLQPSTESMHGPSVMPTRFQRCPAVCRPIDSRDFLRLRGWTIWDNTKMEAIVQGIRVSLRRVERARIIGNSQKVTTTGSYGADTPNEDTPTIRNDDDMSHQPLVSVSASHRRRYRNQFSSIAIRTPYRPSSSPDRSSSTTQRTID